MGGSEEANKATSLHDSSSPSQPLLFKPPSIEEPDQPDQPESDPTQYLQISYNYGPRPFKDLPFIVYVSLPFFVVIPIFFNVYWFVACTVSSSCSDAFPLVYRILVLVFVFLIIGIIVWIFVANWHRVELTVKIIGVASDALSKNLGLFVVIPLLTLGLVVYYAPIVVFLVFARLNGKIVPKESKGEYNGTSQRRMRKPRRSIRSSLRNAFGPSSGTVCLSGLLICFVRLVRAAVDSASQENVPGMVNLVLRCCVKALLSAVDFLNKFTINFVAITGEAYCTSARMTYELLKRNLLSAVFVETVSTRLLAGITFVLSAIYAIVVCAILKGASSIGVYAYVVAALAWALLIIVLGFFAHVLENVIETVYVCYAIDRDRGEVYRTEVHEVYSRLPISRNHRSPVAPIAPVV
ncbi:CHOLINE TRANSPORTER-LIKE (SLC FAMILY 44) [Salix viminalis]|uniref:Choline transporter-like protein n=1 Tax=Salix viminalis TaxID=40686 RepID=A0A9Q0SC42_SALVM|nr:CHOLINE TRANSPORTER-LIKE (SLC FAMILY 44) [Salix viminalis]